MIEEKIFDHKESASHKWVEHIFSESKKETIEKVILQQRSFEKETTEKVFVLFTK